MNIDAVLNGLPGIGHHDAACVISAYRWTG
jgi:hypothetical protein